MNLNLFSLSGLFLAITCFATILVSLILKRTRLSYFWALFNLSLLIWGVASFFAAKATNGYEALTWYRIGKLSILFTPIFCIHLIDELIGSSNRKLVFFAYFQTIVFIPLVPTKYFCSDTRYVFDSFYFYTSTGFIYPIFVACWFSVIALSMQRLIKKFWRSQGQERLRFSYVVFSLGIAFIGGFTNFLPGLGIQIYPFGNLTLPVLCFLTTYAVLNYRLIDFNVAVVRTIIFVCLYTFIFSVTYSLSNKQSLWKFSPWITLVLASAGPFSYVYLRRRAEAIILKEQHRQQNVISELSSKMTRIRDLNELLKTIVSSVVNDADISNAVIYLKETGHKTYQLKSLFPETTRLCYQETLPIELKSIEVLAKAKKPLLSEEVRDNNFKSGLVVPFSIDNALLGFMILGSKNNSKVYTPDDLLIFESLSYSASLAIENCHFWKEIEDRQRKARLQEMDTYSYSLAHEIDNPMQVIIGEGWLLKNDFLKEISEPEKQNEVSESFDYIMEAAQRVSGMVKAIRDFGQPTTGLLNPIKLDEIIESFERLYYPQLKASIVVYKKVTELTSPVFVKGEKPALMQVLVILANNSIHAMQDSPTKKITLKLSAIDKDWIRMEFKDTGHGIKEELLSIIFTPFTTTKASSEGTGMGLYNAKMIIERHNGRIWAESEGEGKGANLVIELPISTDSKSTTNSETKRLY